MVNWTTIQLSPKMSMTSLTKKTKFQVELNVFNTSSALTFEGWSQVFVIKIIFLNVMIAEKISTVNVLEG